MNRISRRLMQAWSSLGPRVLPFADVATPDLPLRRLLRLSLFQVTVGAAMVLLVGTLNRVMIVELGVSAALVGFMIALPLVFAPFRALIGFNSDNHRSELGWRRVPFIWKGTLAQFAGFAIMPFALLVLAGKGQSHTLPAWIGQLAAAAAFVTVGAGVHTVQTAGLALATDLTPQESHPKVVGLMYVMLLLGMIGSALTYGWALSDFSNGRLVQVIQATAVATVFVNIFAMWKQEVRKPRRGRRPTAPEPSFRESWATFCEGEQARRRLVIVGLGTLAFGLADVLLEPFGGQVLQLGVSDTTKLTAVFAAGGLTGFAFASHILNRGADANRISQLGALMGIPGFVAILSAGPTGLTWLFVAGNFLVGFGGALFGHGTLTVTMNRAPKNQAGLAIGAWGAVQATAAGAAMAMSGALRDAVDAVVPAATGGAQTAGYHTVYALEIGLLVVTVAAIVPLVSRRRDKLHAPAAASAMGEVAETGATATKSGAFG